jgi:xylan 1,4-beta-xylosidase
LSGIPGAAKVSISQVNNEVGTAIPKWRTMGSPKYPSANQIADLRNAAELPRPEQRTLAAGQELAIELPPDGIALIEIARR